MLARSFIRIVIIAACECVWAWGGFERDEGEMAVTSIIFIFSVMQWIVLWILQFIFETFLWIEDGWKFWGSFCENGWNLNTLRHWLCSVQWRSMQTNIHAAEVRCLCFYWVSLIFAEYFLMKMYVEVFFKVIQLIWCDSMNLGTYEINLFTVHINNCWRFQTENFRLQEVQFQIISRLSETRWSRT
jgi:hypothetical protein